MVRSRRGLFAGVESFGALLRGVGLRALPSGGRMQQARLQETFGATAHWRQRPALLALCGLVLVAGLTACAPASAPAVTPTSPPSQPATGLADLDLQGIAERFEAAVVDNAPECAQILPSEEVRSVAVRGLQSWAEEGKAPEPGEGEFGTCLMGQFYPLLLQSVVDALPEVPAPGGLGGAPLPANAQGIEALLRRLPGGEVGAAGVTATDWKAAGMLIPGVDTAQVIASLAIMGTVSETAPLPFEYRVAGREGRIVWLHFRYRSPSAGDGIPSEQMQQMQWAEENSDWMFSAGARTEEELLTLVRAFASAASAVSNSSD